MQSMLPAQCSACAARCLPLAAALPISVLQQQAKAGDILLVQAGPGGPRGGGGMARGPGGGGRGMAGPRSGGGRGFAGPRGGGGGRGIAGPRRGGQHFSGPRGPGPRPGIRPGRPGHAGSGRPGGRPPKFRPRPPYYGGGLYAPYGYYSYYGFSTGFDECRWLRERAPSTRSSYWWNRYYECVEDY